MLITPDKLKLAKYIDDEDRRFALSNLFFDKNRVIACNSYILVQVEDTPPNCEEFPHIKGMENIDCIPNKTLVTAKTATKVLKNLPKSKNLPIINNALIETNKEGSVSFGLTDLESSIVVRQRKQEGEYPDVSTCIPTNKPEAKADVNIKYLQKIVGALSEFMNSREMSRIEIALHGPEDAIVFRGKKDDAIMTALVMPLNSGG